MAANDSKNLFRKKPVTQKIIQKAANTMHCILEDLFVGQSLDLESVFKEARESLYNCKIQFAHVQKLLI